MNRFSNVLLLAAFIFFASFPGYARPAMKKVVKKDEKNMVIKKKVSKKIVAQKVSYKGLNLLNNGSIKEISKIKGIGKKTPKANVNFRGKGNKFTKYEDLLKVKNESGRYIFLKKSGKSNKKYEKIVYNLKNEVTKSNSPTKKVKILKKIKVKSTPKSKR